MRNFYFLSNLCKSISGSRGNEPGYDCRFTVVRPSFDRRSAMLKLVSVVAILLTLGVGNVWGAKITYTFSTKAWAASPANWTGSVEGNQFNSSGTPKGVQVCTGQTGVTVTSPTSYTNIKKVEVIYSSSSKGVGKINIKIGDNTALGDQSISKSQTEAKLTFTPASAQTGTVVMTCTVTTNSMGINSVTIYYETAVTLNKNNGTADGSVNFAHDATAYTTSTFTPVTRTDYTCTGYWTASSGGTKILNADGSFADSNITVSTTPYVSSSKWAYTGATLTLHAQWAAPTTVTASPSSITFDDNTVDVGTDDATTTITLSNGYASYGNYLYGWFEDLSDEDHCDFFVNSGYTYSYTTSGSATPTLTISYLADAAGTYTGNFIIQGYNSSYAAVNCTIPLSVTITAACDYQVALTKGTESNGTFSLSSSNGSYDNCDANFVVTVSSIAPSSGYGCTGVTATGGNSTVTGPDGSGNYTVTYTKGNSITSTVTANFAEKVKTPTFGVSGGTYNATQSVTLSCATDGATIYYTTDGKTPTTNSSVYSSAISVTTTNTTIKAIAAKSSMANSDVASATYVLKCATPAISPATGTYTGAQDVTITCATAGASIYYTNNGGTPSSSSTSYSAFSVDATKTIKAIAIKSGWTDSEIATSTITVQYTITWKVNGEAWTPHDPDSDPDDGKENGSSLVNSGTQWSALTLPTDPDPDEDGCGQKFIGWITSTITGELDKDDDADDIADLDILNSGNQSGKTSETITTGTTFHAVFADYAE